jgi:GDP-L-fucose synthase
VATIETPTENEDLRLLDRFRGRRVYLAGHSGMVGSALLRALEPLDPKLLTRSSRELDLRDQLATSEFFERERPEIVLLAAARVGGIQANASAPAEFLYDNLVMAANAIHAAYKFGTQRFVFLGSTCIYPRLAQQPMPEASLMTGPLEPTNEGYALAKIAGLKLCQFYRQQYGVLFHSLMPTNLYGPGDNYHFDHAHVLPALIRRVHEAHIEKQPSVTVWGTGRPLRELLHVDDLANATLHVAALEDPPDWINVGSGDELSILELAKLVADIAGYRGEILTDPSRPDGTPRKLTDSSLLRSTGWRPQIPLREGIERTYREYVQAQEQGLLRAK